MKKYWNLFLYFRKMQLMKQIQYRSDFFFWMFVSLMWTAFNFLFFGLLFGQGNGISGWNYNQILLLLSFYTMIDAFTWSVFYPNMRSLTEEIFSGELSRYLRLPVSTEYLVLTQHANYHNIPRFIVGCAVLFYALQQLNISPTLGQSIAASIVFLCALILIYSLWFFFATICFWVEKLNNINEIMPKFRSVYQVPAHVFTGVTGFVFSYVVPLGLVTTLPSEVLLGRSNPLLIVYFCVMSVLFFSGSIYFFRFSIKKYTSVGG